MYVPYKDQERQQDAQRKSYARNRVRISEQRKANRDHINLTKKENHRTKRDRVSAIKEASPCADCGVSYPAVVMEFDHVRGDKITSVSMMISCLASWEAIEEEIAKCELVCSNCHRLRHALRGC